MKKICEICGDSTEAPIETDLGLMCSNCSEDHFNCDNCGDLLHVEYEMCYDDSTYCDACYNELIYYCCECDSTYRRSSLNEDGRCPDCSSDSDIHVFDYQPEYKFRGKGPLYFGIELEIEFNGVGSDTLFTAADNPYFFLKHDGSIRDGAEVVSHPASFKWINDNFKDTWEKVLDVRQKGMRSFKTSTCGIHIHMSKKAFSKFHLYKFLRFFRENTAFVTKISQRDPVRLQEWSALDSDESILYQAKRGSTSERYVAVNLGPPETVEIRIFRGNLLETAFRKNLEFCKALFDFTDMSSCLSLTAMHFHKFVVKNKKQFPNLLAFLSKLEIKEMKRRPTVNGIQRKFPSEKDRDDKWLIDEENCSKDWVREGEVAVDPEQREVETVEVVERTPEQPTYVAEDAPEDAPEEPRVVSNYTIPPPTPGRTFYSDSNSVTA